MSDGRGKWWNDVIIGLGRRWNYITQLPAVTQTVNQPTKPSAVIKTGETWSLKDANGDVGVYAGGGSYNNLASSNDVLEVGGKAFGGIFRLHAAATKFQAGGSPFGQCQIALDGNTSSVALYSLTYNCRCVLGLEKEQSSNDFEARLRFLDSSGTTTSWIDGGSVSADSIGGSTVNLGGHGKNGLVMLTSSNGELTATIDGEYGSLYLNGDISLQNADCAEEFFADPLSPPTAGSVVVLDEQGFVATSSTAYDTRAAGIVSGAGINRPGLVLDRQPARPGMRVPVALMGKVFCKVDSSYGPIRTGDLLTSSDTPGYAMIARDPQRTAGALVGKALASMDSGKGLIPVLVSLS